MNKYLAIFLLIFFVSPVFASINVNKCDNIKPKGKKIDCLTKLKTDAIKQKAMGPLKKINKKMESLTEKKKAFDKKNKTLWDMYKNRKKQ
jgi:hypothetical protein